MMSSLLLRSWKPLAGLAAALALVLYVSHLRSSLADALADAAACHKATADAETVRSALEAEQARSAALALRANALAADEYKRRNEAIREELRDAPKTDDGPLPRNLDRLLDRLRGE